jgi:conjugal transfer pilus assembly protein TraB
MSMMNENKNSKNKQKFTFYITVFALTGIATVFIFSGGKQSGAKGLINKSKNKIILSDPNHGLKAEDRWLYQAEKKMEDYDKLSKDYESTKTNLEERLNQLDERYQSDFAAQEEILELQKSEIEKLKAEKTVVVNPNSQDPFSSGSQPALPVTKSVQSIEFNLQDSTSFRKAKGYFNAEEYVPAGAYAPAIIISGVDASVGISSQSDPRPVLLRVNGPAVSSIYEGNVQKADISGCIITGAASGDLSSEKVYVQLIKMTCGKPGNKLAEIMVKGYLAGQGKSGIRGNVISREGDFITKSFLAGLIGGFGQGLSAKVAPPLNFSNGLTTQGTLSTGDVINRGIGEGVSTSSQKTQDYLINRAEQYQPVVSIPSGIDVEVVFVDGFYLNNQNVSVANNTQNNNGGQVK